MARLATRIETHNGKPVIVPANQRALDELRGIQQAAKGKVVATVLRYTEDDWLRDRYFGVLDEVSKGLGIHKDALHADLKFKVGLVKAYLLGQSGPVVTLKSIANKSNGGDLTPSERRRYFDDAYEVIFMRYVDAAERPALFERVEQRIGPRPR
jgi:hypothetical protein